MTDDEKTNIVLAKWMGWKAWDSESDIMCGVFPPRLVWTPHHDHHVRSAQNSPPSYTTDLNAVAQIEAKLTDEQWNRYIVTLYEVVGGRHRRLLISATAAQKCQAIVRALGLDGEGAE